MKQDVLNLRLQPSRYLQLYFVLIHGVFMAIVSALAITWGWKLALIALILASLFYYLYHYIRPSGRHHVVQLTRQVNEKWSIRYGDGTERVRLTLLRSLVLPTVCLLYFKAEPRRRELWVWIWADQVDPELFRQLSVYCRDAKTYQQ